MCSYYYLQQVDNISVLCSYEKYGMQFLYGSGLQEMPASPLPAPPCGDPPSVCVSQGFVPEQYEGEWKISRGDANNLHSLEFLSLLMNSLIFLQNPTSFLIYCN